MSDADMVTREEAARAVEQMTRRVALLYVAFARLLVDELGEERGRELIRRAVWDYGKRIGEATRLAVESRGLPPTPENFNAGSDLSPLGFELEAVAADGEARTRIFNCALAQVFAQYGEEDLGKLYCQVDPAKMQAYFSGATIAHTASVLDGAPYCEFATRSLIARE